MSRSDSTAIFFGGVEDVFVFDALTVVLDFVTGFFDATEAFVLDEDFAFVVAAVFFEAALGFFVEVEAVFGVVLPLFEAAVDFFEEVEVAFEVDATFFDDVVGVVFFVDAILVFDVDALTAVFFFVVSDFSSVDFDFVEVAAKTDSLRRKQARKAKMEMRSDWADIITKTRSLTAGIAASKNIFNGPLF